MCYRCDICRGVVPPGLVLQRWPQYRDDRSILSETPVCGECHALLVKGVALYDVLKARQAPPPITVEEVKARPMPDPPKPIPTGPLFNLAVADNGKLTTLPPLKAVEMDPEVLGQRKPRKSARANGAILPQRKLRDVAAETQAIRKRPTVKKSK